MPPSEEKSPASLYKELTEARENHKCMITGKTYIPEQKLLQIVTVPRIKSDLRSRWSWRVLSVFNRGKDKKLLQARKLIAVLAMIGELNGRSLSALVANDLTDDDLPLHMEDHVLQTRRGIKLVGFPSRQEAKMGSFHENQWAVLASFLNLKDSAPAEIKLDARCALELSDCKEIDNTQFSRVFSAKMSSRSDGGRTRLIAVKHFPRAQAHGTYAHEKENLQRIAAVKNDHLIKHLATCDEIHCIIFPLATHGDLNQYWEHKPERIPQSIFIWSIKQLAGLASALRDLHAVNCRHGDLKPSNIFHFKDDGGILKIADLGVSRVHSRSTDQRLDETVTTASTRAYEGPEASGPINAPRSRKYDCWSMGCVILEFVIWLLYNHQALLSFQSFRDKPWRGFYCSNRFDTAFDDEKKEWWEDIHRHPKVDEAIKLLREDARLRGTALEELVDLVDTKLLLINPQSRLEATKIARELHELVERCKAGQTPWVNSVNTPPKAPAIFGKKVSEIQDSTYRKKERREM